MLGLKTTSLVILIVIYVVRATSGFAAPAFVRTTSCSPNQVAHFLSKKNRWGGILINDRVGFSKKTTVRGQRQVLQATIPNDLKGRERLDKFLADCELMGPVRFVCMTDATILETVGSFDNLRYNDLPKGRYATVSEGRDFECHLNTDKIKSIHMVTKRSAKDDQDLFITRFLDEKGETLLSTMLHDTDGAYEPGAIDYWKKLRESFGAEQTLA